MKVGTMQTHQIAVWSDQFGREYTDRNAFTVEELNKDYFECFGLSRVEMNTSFLDGLPLSTRILEIGCNVGNQLRCLQHMGFENLYGIEVQWYAVEKAKELTPRSNILQGSAFDIPFRDGFFDLVFTSGLLIHISPTDILQALREICRCTRKYIWGFEYFADSYTDVNYRGHGSLLWKTDFANLFLHSFSDLRLIKRQKFSSGNNVDEMFLLEKS
jgi:pseudaminic acid biosynthesis-associated methylase